MLGAADDPFITLLRDGSRAAATPSGLQVSPAQRSLSWPALIRVRLWLVWQVLGVNYSDLGMDSWAFLPANSMVRSVPGRCL